MHLFSKENISSNPHASSIHPVIQTSTIILQTELFPKKRREKIQGEILQSIFEYSGVSIFYKNYSVSTRNPASFQSSHAKKNYSTYRINSTTRNLQEILQLQGSSRTRHLPATVPRVSKHSTRQNPAIRPLQHKQASSNSTR